MNPPSSPPSMPYLLHNDVLQVLCRVFDDGADVAMEEWREWYQPEQWLHGYRALGAFIRQRLERQSSLGEGTGTNILSPAAEALTRATAILNDPTLVSIDADYARLLARAVVDLFTKQAIAALEAAAPRVEQMVKGLEEAKRPSAQLLDLRVQARSSHPQHSSSETEKR